MSNRKGSVVPSIWGVYESSVSQSALSATDATSPAAPSPSTVDLASKLDDIPERFVIRPWPPQLQPASDLLAHLEATAAAAASNAREPSRPRAKAKTAPAEATGCKN